MPEKIFTKNRKISPNFKLESTELTAKKKRYESIALSDQMPVVWHKAKDFNVYDRDGNKWIDMTSGIFVANAGHSNEYIKDAIKKQMDDDLMFAFLYNTEIRYQLIEKLLDVSPDHFEKVALLCTGSEITDIASKLIKFWARKNNRKHIVSFRGSYHGRTLGSDLLCGNENSTDWSNVVDDDIVFIDFPYKSDDVFNPTLLGDPSNIAAFMLETYQGWGAYMYPKHYINDLYDFAKKHGILVCFDEVQSGFYRMGELYGYMTYGDHIKPDIVCLGKGITSSLPLSALLTTREVMDVDKKAVVGGTHSGNAVCCAAAIANIEFLVNKSFQKELKSKVALYEKKNQELLRYDIVETVNCRGMVSGVIFENAEQATAVVEACIRRGVLPVCTFKKAVKLAPPLTITEEAIVESYEVINEAIMETMNVI